ncbi:hypothetical protein [Microbacterium terregens]|uniref:Helix-turn-helix domain-containing protein n=1 Tax=Microbacterium terregens TaxID=69363 RepID=A0ABV5SVY0_9MICO
MNDDGERFAQVPHWLQDNAHALGIGPGGIAAYAVLYRRADWSTGLIETVGMETIARLSGSGSRMTATAAVKQLLHAGLLEIVTRRRTQPHIYRLRLPAEGPPSSVGVQNLATMGDAETADQAPVTDDEKDLGAQNLATGCLEIGHHGAQNLATFRSTDLSRSLKADPSGLAGAMPAKSGDPEEIGSAVSSLAQTDHLAIGSSAPNVGTGDLTSTGDRPSHRSPRARASRAQILWLRDLRAMTGTGLENPDPLTVHDADAEIRDLWPEIERRRHRGDPLDGNYWDLSPRARVYVDEHDLDIDRREAS